MGHCVQTTFIVNPKTVRNPRLHTLSGDVRKERETEKSLRYLLKFFVKPDPVALGNHVF